MGWLDTHATGPLEHPNRTNPPANGRKREAMEMANRSGRRLATGGLVASNPVTQSTATGYLSWSAAGWVFVCCRGLSGAHKSRSSAGAG